MTNIAFVIEQALGHVTHHQNLARWVEEDASITPTWLPVAQDVQDVWERVPGIRGNWSLKSSLRARALLNAAGKTQRFDALFLHTQTTALFTLDWMRRVPTVVSLDATPKNYDEVGAQYGHIAGDDGWLERRKFRWNQRTFEGAAALTTWCEWAKHSLCKDYGIRPDKVTVIPPGVDMERWDFGRAQSPMCAQNPLRLLFVGGDFARKGGPELIEAFTSGLRTECVLDVVTKDAQAAAELKGVDGVRVHTGLTANSDGLRELYATADLFVFPTRGDCMPLAVMEAMAAGLPVIATDVGALREEVEAGVNGLMVAPNAPQEIIGAVRALSADPARRQSMGRASRELAERRFDACRNYNAILSLLKSVANGTRSQSP